MKKLTLLLTSLLLATGANAGITDFETITDTSSQNVEVAHACVRWKQHMGGGHKHGILYHTDDAICVQRSTIDKCTRLNRVVKPWGLGNKIHALCGDECPLGQRTGEDHLSDTCVPEDCPKGTAWQALHKKCVHIWELVKYCKDEFNLHYNHGSRKCEACPEGSFPQQSGCRTLSELNAYCATLGKLFNPTNNNCDTMQSRIDWCNGRDEIYVAERNRCEKCAEWHPHRGANKCFKERTEALTHYCSTLGKRYNSASDQCE